MFSRFSINALACFGPSLKSIDCLYPINIILLVTSTFLLICYSSRLPNFSDILVIAYNVMAVDSKKNPIRIKPIDANAILVSIIFRNS